MHYCGVVAAQGAIQLAMLEEVRTPEPPIRLNALFYEPGSAEEVARGAAYARGRGDRLRRAPGRPAQRAARARLRRAAAAGAGSPRRPRPRRPVRWQGCCATSPPSSRTPRSRPARSTRAPTGASRCSRPTPTASSVRSRAGACPRGGTRSASGGGSRSWPGTTSSTTAATSGTAASRRSTRSSAHSARTATRSATRAGWATRRRASWCFREPRSRPSSRARA